MSSWHDDITGYHNEGTDDMHIGKNDLNDVFIVTINRSPLIRLFKKP